MSVPERIKALFETATDRDNLRRRLERIRFHDDAAYLDHLIQRAIERGEQP